MLLLPNGHQSRLLIPIAAIFTGVLIVSNIVAIKMVNFDGLNPFGAVYFPGAVIVFPISYIFGDILAEVYGFRIARITIWSAFLPLTCVLVSINPSVSAVSIWFAFLTFTHILVSFGASISDLSI